jgi:hypothetical protein
MRNGKYGYLYEFVLIIIIALVVLVALSSCRTKYVEVPTVHTNYIVQTDTFLSKDKEYIHDSIYICQEADTIYKYRERFVKKYIDNKVTVHDTTRVHDSIPYPVYQQVEVEKQLTDKEQKYMKAGKALYTILDWAIVIAVLGLIAYIGYRWNRWKKKA